MLLYLFHGGRTVSSMVVRSRKQVPGLSVSECVCCLAINRARRVKLIAMHCISKLCSATICGALAVLKEVLQIISWSVRNKKEKKTKKKRSASFHSLTPSCKRDGKF